MSLVADTKRCSWEWHFFKGLSFGYPVCCVLWYCSSWTNLGEQYDSMYEHLSEGNPYAEEVDWLKDADYQKCPECLIEVLN